MSAAASAGVVAAGDDLVVAEALVPDAADHLAGDVPDLPPHGESPRCGCRRRRASPESVSSVVISTRRSASALSSSIWFTSRSRASARANSVTMGFLSVPAWEPPRRKVCGEIAHFVHGREPSRRAHCATAERRFQSPRQHSGWRQGNGIGGPQIRVPGGGQQGRHVAGAVGPVDLGQHPFTG